jgi:hypothetical protein
MRMTSSHVVRIDSLDSAIKASIDAVRLDGRMVDAGHWQGVPTEGKPDLQTKEILGLRWEAPMPETIKELQTQVMANLPWAEHEFQERVGGKPHNPHKSMDEWPWWRGQIDRQMSHTYSERFWPPFHEVGIRFEMGNLHDVVTLLIEHPYTRQAYVPIFFPEDTGAVHGARVPCTLGYHFLLRNLRLHLWYDIRSCDAIRHFADDVYLAVRLCQWMIAECRRITGPGHYPWSDTRPGDLYFGAHSFHYHMGDAHHLP